MGIKRKRSTGARTITWLYFFITFGGCWLATVLFKVQENFYAGTNDLHQWYVAAGIWQLSLTSATAVWFYTGAGLLAVLIFADFYYTRRVRQVLFSLIAVGWVVYSGYEVFQVFFPAYYDRNFLDIVVAALASLILALPLIVIRPTD